MVPAEEERITEVLPDGTIQVRVIRKETKRVRTCVRSIVTVDENGEVVRKDVKTRAFLQYQGPGGGYKMKFVSDDGTEQNSEDEDDDDSRSMSPSELRDNESALVQYIEGPSGTRIPNLQVKPARVDSSKEKRLQKAWCATNELVETEERYVQKLHLLDQEFRQRIEKGNFLSKDKYQRIFANLESLYGLHNGYLLPKLLDRRRDWDDLQGNQKISDVIRSKAAFLKMYSEYTNNYKRATKVYEECMKSSKKFNSIVHEVEKLPECDNLPLISHLICPVQRVMRYHLLLQEYLKNLPDDHPDKADTKAALEQVLEAANHANEMMKKLDRYKDVIEVQEMLGGQISDLVTPSRELVKKGQLTKISGRSTDKHELREVFLLSDMLLLCSKSKGLSLTKCKLRAVVQIDGMKVCEGDRLDTENSFYIRTPHRKLELYANSAEEKHGWIDCLQSVIREHSARIESFRRPDGDTLSRTPSPHSQSSSPSPGSSAEKPKKCVSCRTSFSPFKKERICKSCCAVLCSKCCNKKIDLGNSNGKKKKSAVCGTCFEKISCPTPDANGENNVLSRSRKNILAVKANDEASIYSGYMELCSAYKRQWMKRYFSVDKDFVLYSFESSEDCSALTALPLPGCEVGLLEGKELSEETDRDRLFKVTHYTRVYYLKVPTQQEMAKWMAIIELASKAEIPEDATTS